MYYYDEIDMVEKPFPKKEDVSGVKFENDVVFIELKDESVFNVCSIYESLTKDEFKKIAHYIFSKLK